MKKTSALYKNNIKPEIIGKIKVGETESIPHFIRDFGDMALLPLFELSGSEVVGSTFPLMHDMQYNKNLFHASISYFSRFHE